METDYVVLISLAILAVAFLYSSVGHAGASGYIAVLSLAGVSTVTIRPLALALNVLVAGIATWQFYRAGFFSWRLFWPFAILSIPFSFLGGTVDLPTRVLHFLLGAVLLFSAVRFFLRPQDASDVTTPSTYIAIPLGGGLGFVSGLTGTGGGIFLTPLLLMMKWAQAKKAAAVSAAFILVNSIAGLLGNFSATNQIPEFAVTFAISAMAGGILGSYFGSRRLPHDVIKRLLAVVLVIAGCKLIFVR